MAAQACPNGQAAHADNETLAETLAPLSLVPFPCSPLPRSILPLSIALT